MTVRPAISSPTPIRRGEPEIIAARQKAFQQAIEQEDVSLVRQYLQEGLDPNFEINGKPMLVHAAFYPKSLEIFYLIEARFQGEVDPILPFTLRAREYVTPELLERYPLSEGDYQKLHTKAVALFYNITGMMPDGRDRLEGGFSNFTNPYLSSALSAFQRRGFLKNCKIGMGFQRLLEAFRETHRPGRTSREVAEEIHQGELCFVNSGWSGHAITLCFFEDYMAICNRGDGSTEEGTLKVFKIDRKKVTEELLQNIELAKGYPQGDGLQFLYQQLPRALEGSQDELCHAFASVAPQQQKVGNCVLTSPKAALRFAWIMLLRDQGVDQPFDVGRSESKNFTDFAAHYVLEAFGDNMVEGFREMEGVSQALETKNLRIQQLHDKGKESLVRRLAEAAHSFKEACMRTLSRVTLVEVR